jgi:hypothetical protein
MLLPSGTPPFAVLHVSETPVRSSVADLGCLSQILILMHSGSNNSNKRGGGKISCPSVFCSHKYHNTENNFLFEQVKKKVSVNSQELYPF